MSLSCDLILVSWNKLEYTRACIESVMTHTTVPYRLIVVDNGSAPETIDYLHGLKRQHPDRILLVLHDEDLGWVKGANDGLRRSEAPYACLLNNDLLVAPGWLERMIAVAEADPLIGLVNPTYKHRGETPEAFLHRAQQSAVNGTSYIEVNECNGACLLVRRRLREVIGELDESYGSGGMDDSDYSRRAEVAGFRCARARHAYVFHWENVSLNTVPNYWLTIRPQNEALFRQRWGERTQLGVVLAEDEEEVALRILRRCLALARLGVRVHVFVLVPASSGLTESSGRWDLGLVEHNNLKWTVRTCVASSSLSQWWLLVEVSGTALARRRKNASHRIQALIAPSDCVRTTLHRLEWLHRTPTYASVEECPVVQRQWEWARAIDATL